MLMKQGLDYACECSNFGGFVFICDGAGVGEGFYVIFDREYSIYTDLYNGASMERGYRIH